MKRLFLASIAIIFCNLLNAQIQVNHITTGTYGYNSLYQGADLHFYLLNDGHYSFEPNLVHEFGTNANGNTVNAYHSEPYDNDQVEKITLNTVNDGIALPMIPYYNFPNKVALMRSWELVNGKENFFILIL